MQLTLSIGQMAHIVRMKRNTFLTLKKNRIYILIKYNRVWATIQYNTQYNPPCGFKGMFKNDIYGNTSID